MQVRKKSSKKILIILLLTALIVAAGVAIFLYFTIGQKTETNRPNPDNQTQSEEKEKEKQDKNEATTTKEDPAVEEEKDIQPPYEGENPNASKSLTGVINFKSVIDGTLTIRNTINQALSSGTCDLTMTNGSKTVTKNSGIAQNPSSSSCEGFDIPVSELSSGSWKISIIVTSGDRTGTIVDEVAI